MTDNEIIKALESCGNHLDCVDCECVDNCPQDINELNGLTFDLINSLQTKVLKEQNKNSKLRNERNRLKSQNNDLSETVHNLTIEKDTLFDKIEELKAEVERLKEFIVESRRCDKEIKFEARKEFAEKIEERIAVKLFRNKSNEYVEGFIDALDDVNDEMNNLLKEFERKENTTYDD